MKHFSHIFIEAAGQFVCILSDEHNSPGMGYSRPPPSRTGTEGSGEDYHSCRNKKGLMTQMCIDEKYRRFFTCPPEFSMSHQERWRTLPVCSPAVARCCLLVWSPQVCHNLLMVTVSWPGMVTRTVLTPPGMMNVSAALCWDVGM